ncbi:MAG: hypothetical protein IJ272_00305 [Clostridia bacterium]|nr:hypothetical protein [Clostridia bacterium]
MEVTNIINAINTIAEKIYKSVEGEVFKSLDDLLIINEKILDKEPLKMLFVNSDGEGLIVLAMSFVIFFFVYYIIARTIAMYNGENVDNIFKYILRVVICVICSASSLFLIEQILNINGLLTEAIANIGKDLTGEKMCFESLREVVLNLDEYMSQEALSIDGIIKGVISFGATTILITFAIRYVTLIFLLLISPIAIMFAASGATYGIFKSWVKMLCGNLLIQNVVVIILMIPLSVKDVDNDLFKIILVGSIYLLYRINNFSKEFLGNISEQIVRRK